MKKTRASSHNVEMFFSSVPRRGVSAAFMDGNKNHHFHCDEIWKMESLRICKSSYYSNYPQKSYQVKSIDYIIYDNTCKSKKDREKGRYESCEIGVQAMTINFNGQELSYQKSTNISTWDYFISSIYNPLLFAVLITGGFYLIRKT